VVYKNGSGLDHLERGVLSALALVGRLPRAWNDLWEWLDPQFAARTAEQPWHEGYSSPLPFWMEADGLTEFTECLQKGLESFGVRLIGLFCRAVFPCEFNELVAASNKADALSRITLGLVGDALTSLPLGRTIVFCDKHGGRDYYLPLLQQQFPDNWIEVRRESGMASDYRFGGEEQPAPHQQFPAQDGKGRNQRRAERRPEDPRMEDPLTGGGAGALVRDARGIAPLFHHSHDH
jgi:hypothetical protein